MKAVVAAFNQEKALVGAFSVIVQPVVEPIDSFTTLLLYLLPLQLAGQRAQHKLDLVRVDAALFIFPKHPDINNLISLGLLTFICPP